MDVGKLLKYTDMYIKLFLKFLEKKLSINHKNWKIKKFEYINNTIPNYSIKMEIN